MCLYYRSILEMRLLVFTCKMLYNTSICMPKGKSDINPWKMSFYIYSCEREILLLFSSILLNIYLRVILSYNKSTILCSTHIEITTLLWNVKYLELSPSTIRAQYFIKIISTFLYFAWRGMIGNIFHGFFLKLCKQGS